MERYFKKKAATALCLSGILFFGTYISVQGLVQTKTAVKFNDIEKTVEAAVEKQIVNRLESIDFYRQVQRLFGKKYNS